MDEADAVGSRLGPVLATQPFFAGLDAETLDVIAGCAANVRFDEGEYIFREGDPTSDFYVIRFGRVCIETDIVGRGPHALQTLGEGEVMGWSWLLPPHRWQFDGRAVEPVRAIRFDGKCLRRKCEESDRLGYRLLSRVSDVLTKRLKAARLQVMDVYGR